MVRYWYCANIEMSEDTWLELLLAFITNEEKQTLQVSAREQRAAHDNNAGYDVLTLQRSLNRFDPATFRKFQQGHCHDPVALRVLALHRLVAAEKAGITPKVELGPSWKLTVRAKIQPRPTRRSRTISSTERAPSLSRKAS